MRLDPSRVAYHQLVTFAPDRAAHAEALTRSPLFHVERQEHGTVGEWLQRTAESDRSVFPLGRISVHTQGILLETLCEDRLRELRGCLAEAGLGHIPSDELRVFPVADALAHPGRLLQPLREAAGEPLTVRDVAVDYLRMAWAFLPHEELGGRTPQAVLHTGRGRAALESIVCALPRSLRRRIPSFPAFAVDDLLEILLPAETAPASAPPVAHPAARRSKD